MPEIRAQVADIITKLTDKDLVLLKEYGEYLLWRSQQASSTTEGRNPIAQRILEFMKQPPKLSQEDVEALMQSIEEGKIPVRYDSPFEGTQ